MNHNSFIHSLIFCTFRLIISIRVFGLREETGAPSENPHIHLKDMQTSQSWEPKQEPCCSEVTALTTAPYAFKFMSMVIRAF